MKEHLIDVGAVLLSSRSGRGFCGERGEALKRMAPPAGRGQKFHAHASTGASTYPDYAYCRSLSWHWSAGEGARPRLRSAAKLLSTGVRGKAQRKLVILLRQRAQLLSDSSAWLDFGHFVEFLSLALILCRSFLGRARSKIHFPAVRCRCGKGASRPRALYASFNLCQIVTFEARQCIACSYSR